MDRQYWLDVDLDFFNEADDPVEELAALLNTVSKSTPAAIMVEHHRAVAHVRRAILSGYLRTPFTVLHVDQHHDFYRGPYRKTMHCGNLGYFLETEWYDCFTWVASDEADKVFTTCLDDWDEAQEWLWEQGKEVEFIRHHPWKTQGWSPERIGYATFAVSPDYLNDSLLDCAEDMVKLVSKHFGLTTTVVPPNPSRPCGYHEQPQPNIHLPWRWGTSSENAGVIDLRLRDNIATGRLRCRPG